jgi:hypothetical protein
MANDIHHVAFSIMGNELLNVTHFIAIGVNLPVKYALHSAIYLR